MNAPSLTPEQQFAKQAEWSAKVMQMTQIQEQIVRTRNIGKIRKAKLLMTKSYIHRRLGMGNPFTQVAEFAVASGYGAYASAAADIDF
jgi:hypothetical protein